MLIYQLEISNICSLTCGYCPHPNQRRPKGMMSFDTFKKCVEFYRTHSRTRPLHLHHFGEPILHPQLVEFVAHAASRDVETIFFTNGLLAKKTPAGPEYWKELADAGLRRVNFSSHNLAEKEFRAIAEPYVKVERVYDPRRNRRGTWAGQTGEPEVPVAEPCFFERRNAFVVLWNGDLARCCLDPEGRDSPGTIDDLLAGMEFKFAPFLLCDSCASLRGEEEV